MVFVKLQTYQQQSVSKRAHQKLASRYYGPYEVGEHIGPVAYKSKFPTHSLLHPVFHVSMLKQSVDDHLASSTELPPINDESNFLVKPEAILDTRWVKHG